MVLSDFYQRQKKMLGSFYNRQIDAALEFIIRKMDELTERRYEVHVTTPSDIVSVHRFGSLEHAIYCGIYGEEVGPGEKVNPLITTYFFLGIPIIREVTDLRYVLDKLDTGRIDGWRENYKRWEKQLKSPKSAPLEIDLSQQMLSELAPKDTKR